MLTRNVLAEDLFLLLVDSRYGLWTDDSEMLEKVRELIAYHQEKPRWYTYSDKMILDAVVDSLLEYFPQLKDAAKYPNMLMHRKYLDSRIDPDTSQRMLESRVRNIANDLHAMAVEHRLSPSTVPACPYVAQLLRGLEIMQQARRGSF